MIKIKLQTASLHPTDTKEHYMYDEGGYARLREEMDIDWENEFKPCKNVEDMWGTFIRKYENADKLCIPKRKIRIRKLFKMPLDKKSRKNSETKKNYGRNSVGPATNKWVLEDKQSSQKNYKKVSQKI